MARKSKRMAFHEAIRRGQAKIARGLESGQLRSDGIPRSQTQRGIPDDKALLQNREKSPQVTIPSKIFAFVSGFAIVIVLFFVIWFVMYLFGGPEPAVREPGSPESQSPRMQASSTTEEQSRQAASGSVGTGGQKIVDEQPAQRQTTLPSAPPGSNVIVITQVPGTDQQDKLLPVMEYYNASGIPTETVQRSGYTLLITRAGFDYNPNRQGTEGYRLMQRIKQLGLDYPEATGDTSFTLRPFQDAYALKK
jgi:hypothetical protein